MAAARERANAPENSAEAIEARVAVRFDRGLEVAGERLAKVELDLDSLRTTTAKFQKDAAADLHAIEAEIATQEAAVQSARTAMAQTDDLVERVVEALESLQSAVLEQSEEHVALAS
jgi:uncharacterized protein YhaN